LNAAELQSYLHEHIPLSAAMQIEVRTASTDQVALGAPLGPNINHRETAFGGSMSALAILSAWSLLHVKLTADGYKTRLVIQRNSMGYGKPVLGYFTAHARSPEPAQWKAFTRMLERKGLGRISVSSVLIYEGEDVGRFEGEFVALGSSDASRASIVSTA